MEFMVLISTLVTMRGPPVSLKEHFRQRKTELHTNKNLSRCVGRVELTPQPSSQGYCLYHTAAMHLV